MVSEDDELLSAPLLGTLTYREAHAFVHGLYAGVFEGSRRTDYADGKEDHYWRGGYLLTASARYAALVYLLTS